MKRLSKKTIHVLQPLLLKSKMEGQLALMPVLLAVPCNQCSQPGNLCKLCGMHYCGSCEHNCDAYYEDSPGVSEDDDDDNLAVIGETGGSRGGPPSTLYDKLRELSERKPDTWIFIEDSLYVRIQSLPEVNTCYIVDEEGRANKFGSLGDWRSVYQFMSWHHAGFVIINTDQKKCYLLEPGKNIATVDIKFALRWLRFIPTALGYVINGDEESIAYLEVSWSRNDEKPMKRCLARDKLVMAIIRTNAHVVHWKE
jgi:hypothetical protein